MRPGIAGSRSPPGLLRLLAPALGCWALIAWSITSPGAAGAASLIAGLTGAVLLSLAVVGRSTKARRALGLLAVFCAMVVLIGVRTSAIEQTRAYEPFLAASEQGWSVVFEGRLAAYPESRSTPFGERAWVRAQAITERGSVPVLLWLDAANGIPQHWAPGTLVEVRGRLEARPPADPAAYSVQVLQVEEAAVQPWWEPLSAHAAGLRSGLVALCARVQGAELVPGFAVGDTSLVSEQLDRAMLASSLTHLTAVSGSNTGLIIAAVIFICSRMGVGRRVRIAIALFALGGFVVLVGPDASVQRAAVMAAVLLASGFGGRRSSAFASLGLAVIVLLVLDPWQSLQPGFALSVAATAGIVLICSPVAAALRRVLRLPGWLALSVSVALAAQLACGPLLLLLQPGIPAVGVLANVIAAPAAPLGTGLGLLAALLAPVSPALAHLAVLAASLFARWVAATAMVANQLPLARWHWPEGWAGAVLLAACQSALLLAWMLHTGRVGLLAAGARPIRAPWRPRPEAPIAIRLAVALLACSSAGAILAVTVATPLALKIGTPRQWAVVACDIGQGDAILLRDPSTRDQTMLVDTGDEPELLIRCLDRFGVDRISLLVLTHDDRDHVGALEAILGRVDSALISQSILGESFESREVVQRLASAGIPFALAEAGLSDAAVDGGVGWVVLAPAHNARSPDSNSASIVMLAEVGRISVLLLGDTGEQQQRELLKAQPQLEARVLKVAHHGSRDQHEPLMRRVGAELALISAGAGNGYGHPTDETLALLGRAGTGVLRTDQLGSIAIIPASDGALEVWAEGER